MIARYLALAFFLAFTGAAHADSLWDHNGSVMRLVAEGNHRTFLYESPRGDLQRAGVTRGTVLFEGVRDGQRYEGVARHFSRNCEKPLLYRVTGTVETETRVVLHGERDIFDSGCRPTGETRSDTLVFTYLRESVVRNEAGSLPEGFRGTWTSQDGDCTADYEHPGSAQVITIDSQITTWKIYPPQSVEDDAYDWCDAGSIRRISDRQLIADLDCAHPGHSRRDVTLRILDAGRISMNGTAFFRCE